MQDDPADPGPTDPDPATAPAAGGTDQARIAEYLRSGDWEARVKAARLQREEVLARRANQAAESKPSALRVQPDPALPIRSAAEGGAAPHPRAGGLEAKLKSARQERAHLQALQRQPANDDAKARLDAIPAAAAKNRAPPAPLLLVSKVLPELPVWSEEAEPPETPVPRVLSAPSVMPSPRVLATPVVLPAPKIVADRSASGALPAALPQPGPARRRGAWRLVVGLAIGLGIGLVIGYAAGSGWIADRVKGFETAGLAWPTGVWLSGDVTTDLPDAGPAPADAPSPNLSAQREAAIARAPVPDQERSPADPEEQAAVGSDAPVRPQIDAAPQDLDPGRTADRAAAALPGAAPPGPGHLPDLRRPALRARTDAAPTPAPAPARVAAFPLLPGSRPLVAPETETEPETATRPLPAPAAPSENLAAQQAQALSDPTTDPLPKTSQVIPIVAGDRYQILLHGGSDLNATALRDLGLTNARQVPSDLTAARMTVAFYTGADAELATALALKFGGSLIDLTGFSPSPPPHTLDLYFTD